MKVSQPPAQQPVLCAIGGGLAVAKLAIDGKPLVPPREHHDDAGQSKTVGSVCMQAPFLGQWMHWAGLVFTRAVYHPRTHPIVRWGHGGNDLVGNPPPQDAPIPIRRFQQPMEMPFCNVACHQPGQPFDGGFLLLARMAHEAPTKRPMMTVAKQRP
jgi:hypothetical protein